MSAYTPGPWSPMNHYAAVATIDGRIIADIHHRKHGYDYTAEANTRLIAAAPDLLKACRAVLADGFLDRPSLNACRIAIAKAEGTEVP